MLHPLRSCLFTQREGMPVQAPESAVSGFCVSPYPCITQHIKAAHNPVSCGVRAVLARHIDGKAETVGKSLQVSPLSLTVSRSMTVMEGVGLSLPGVVRVRKNGRMGKCHEILTPVDPNFYPRYDTKA